jgi:hypothetical protein
MPIDSRWCHPYNIDFDPSTTHIRKLYMPRINLAHNKGSTWGRRAYRILEDSKWEKYTREAELLGFFTGTASLSFGLFLVLRLFGILGEHMASLPIKAGHSFAPMGDMCLLGLFLCLTSLCLSAGWTFYTLKRQNMSYRVRLCRAYRDAFDLQLARLHDQEAQARSHYLETWETHRKQCKALRRLHGWDEGS